MVRRKNGEKTMTEKMREYEAHRRELMKKNGPHPEFKAVVFLGGAPGNGKKKGRR